MSRYSHGTYSFQEELTHFGLTITTHFGLHVMGHFGIDTTNEKWERFSKFFEYKY